jgi:DNA/RNA-binding domain of Phe-tRNA-synthetase-like protein
MLGGRFAAAGNWKEAERTKLTERTTNAVLVLESLSPITRDEFEAASEALSLLVRERCGGVVTRASLDRSCREVALG